jgi:hypothetical protein
MSDRTMAKRVLPMCYLESRNAAGCSHEVHNRHAGRHARAVREEAGLWVGSSGNVDPGNR